MKRLILVVLGLGVVVVLGLLVFVFTGLGAAIKSVVENVGSAVTQTDVKLASADVSVTSGEGQLKGLVVGNPKGYSTPSAIELGEIKVSLDTATVTSDTVVIKEVLIDGPHLTYELGPGGSNIGVIQENVAAFGGGGGGKGGKPSGGAKEPSGGRAEGGTKVIIENLIVRNGRVDVSASFLKGQSVGAGLAEIHLRDIGKSSGGATAAEVTQQLLGALTESALDAVAGLNIEGLKKGVGEALGGAVKDIFGGGKKKK
jgi:Na+-transporting methylmalonyl-CoA/oxaloacetate decarboxylase gamma subunit